MKGRFPDLLNNPATSEAARKLWDETQAMLDLVIKEKWLTANGVFGLFPARPVDEDDVAVYSDETYAHGITRLNNIRQQSTPRAGGPQRRREKRVEGKDRLVRVASVGANSIKTKKNQ